MKALIPDRRAVARPAALVPLLYLAVVVAAVAAAPLLAPYDPIANDLHHVLSGPRTPHPLGTDQLGRDLLSRLLFGGRVSLLGAAEAVAVILVLGVPAGLLAGYYPGAPARVLTWVSDAMLAIPVVVILLMALSVFGHSETAAMLTLGLLGVPNMLRVVRGATFAVRGEPYVAAARAGGLGDRHIVFGQVLPRVTGPIIVQASLFAGTALLTQSALDYLGLGVQPPAPTWGGMVAEASAMIDRQPWMLVPSGGVIALTILAFGLLGDAVRDTTAGRAPTSRPRVRPWRAPDVSAPEPDGPEPLLRVRGMTVAVPGGSGPRTVVEDLDLDIAPGECVGLVGESGCGKSVTGRALSGLPGGGQVTGGSIRFAGTELTGLSQRELRRIRGTGIARIAQDPLGSLDPAYPVGTQLAELVRRHDGGQRAAVRTRVAALLAGVRLRDPGAVAGRYPHQLSGGMAQRVAIALALAGRPRLLVADEPTTALDVTVQAEILDLLRDLSTRTGMAILLITHDWGVVADLCARTYVMYAGHIMEAGPTEALVDRPAHPYTAALLDCMPSAAKPGAPLRAIPGTVPTPEDWPHGCHFRVRCPIADDGCAAGPIPVARVSGDHLTRCIHPTRVRGGGHEFRAADSGRE